MSVLESINSVALISRGLSNKVAHKSLDIKSPETFMVTALTEKNGFSMFVYLSRL